MSRAFQRSEAGITLLELVIVMMLFALVAVMGLQALSGAMRADARLSAVDDQTAQMTRTLSLLRNDLKSADSRVFWPPGTDEPARAFIDLSAKDGVLEFTIAGQPVLPDVQAAGFSRVIWRHDRDNARLTRQVWPVLRPGADRAQAPEVEMLPGIVAMQVLSYAGEKAGWVEEFGTEARPFDTPLPEAVDLRLESEVYGPLRIVVRF
jgi:general secretion pathway protein J